MSLPDGLLTATKTYLDITWDMGADEQAKLEGILLRGMDYIDRAAGAAMDYAEEKQPRALLLDYARYARAGALDEFALNYLHDLLGLQIAQEIAQAAGDGDDT